MEGIKLSKRLTVAAGAIREGSRVADVGCDHGKLGAYLITSGRAPFVTATDISEPSLKKARELFDTLGITARAKIVLCDGLSEVRAEDADDVVIAGLGNDTIIKIICDCRWLRNPEKRLVLVPASHHERLRKSLYAAGFKIENETAVYEDRQFYTVITASYTGVLEDKGEAFCSLGKISGEDAEKYTDWVYKKNKLILSVPASRERKETAKRIVSYIEEKRQ